MVRASLAAAVILAVAGCEGGPSPFGAANSSSDNIVPPEMSRASAGADVEAPDVFQLSGEGLWDGRPSLGGVWVAHSSVIDPERVMIRNPTNGKSVVGALFRRERDTPGPSLQVSSDAAEALGMLAGQPADLNVVALRREEPQAPAPAAPEPATEVAEDAAPTDAATPDPESAVAASATDAAALPAPAAAAPKPAKRGLFGLFRKKPKQEPVTDEPVAAGVASGSIEQAPLEDVTATASAAIDRAEDVDTAVAAAPAAPAPSSLQRAYVQIGIFSTEANANRAGGQMKAAGMTATIIPDESQGKTYWRVIVGPAASGAERDALAARVKGIGYPDAYPVTN